MKAYFDENGKPRVEIVTGGADKKKKIVCSIDTGFNGALMLSLPDALGIGLKLFGVGSFELADGSVKKEYVFSGSVVLRGRSVPVEILLTTSEESLLGTELLRESLLTIDFPRRKVSITPSKP